MEQSKHNPAVPDPVTVRLSVGSLAETIHRSGGLIPDISGSSAAEGIRLHGIYCDALIKKHGSDLVMTEVGVEASHQSGDYCITVNGRCDAIVSARLPDELDRIIEIKTHNLPAHRLPATGDPVHWAQLKLYGHLYLHDKPDHNQLVLELVYLRISDRTRTIEQQCLNRDELAGFFVNSCSLWMERTSQWLSWQKIRDHSAIICRFPYQEIRQGQKELMREVLSCVRSRGLLLAQAPTGTGKTMSVLFPAVKALGHHLIDHVFYLTAMSSTRQAAVQAMNDLRLNGLHMRSLMLHAKEKLCLEPDLYCDTTVCGYARHYYDHLPDALGSLLRLEELSVSTILSCARRYKVCPFELSLDIALYCDVIICDYNYAFDPRVRLDRFFGSQPRNCLLLVDEAHNLPNRSREMFSAQIDERSIREAADLLKKNETESFENTDGIHPLFPADDRWVHLSMFLNRLLSWFDSLRVLLAENPSDQGFEVVENQVQPGKTMKAVGFLAMRSKPDAFVSLLARCSYFIRVLLDAYPDLETKAIWRDLFFKISFFLRMADLFDQNCHITTVRHAAADSTSLNCNLMCLDASGFLTAQYHMKNAAVFFSATLNPMRYYASLINSKTAENPPDMISLSSPFPSENLLIMSYNGLSARYRDRDQTMPAMLDIILEAVQKQIGNYLVFVPSFAYLNRFRKLLRARRPENMDCLLQIPAMNEELKQTYLDRFNQHGCKTLLAIAVIGSLFNEGIDLVGEKLSGVIIIGAGLPQVSPEQEILRQFYDEKLGSGYAYSYVYPGFNKIQQAAGRLIRSENDRGFVLLLDDRFEQYEYQQLFPHEWHVQSYRESVDLLDNIAEFWQS